MHLHVSHTLRGCVCVCVCVCVLRSNKRRTHKNMKHQTNRIHSFECYTFSARCTLFSVSVCRVFFSVGFVLFWMCERMWMMHTFAHACNVFFPRPMNSHMILTQIFLSSGICIVLCRVSNILSFPSTHAKWWLPKIPNLNAVKPPFLKILELN